MKTFLLMLVSVVWIGWSPFRAMADFERIDVNGYMQARAVGAHDGGNFYLRRTKLWVKGHESTLPVSFKLQTLFRWNDTGEMDLQDAYADYSPGKVSFRIGQFVPGFSLEWSQPDAVLPVLERAKVVNALIPGSRTMGREIGVQVHGMVKGAGLQETLGLFPGHGANDRGTVGRDFLVTNRIVFGQSLWGWTARAGYSTSWRRITDGVFPSLLGADSPFTGNDVRQGVEGVLKHGPWSFQGEYLWANLGGSRSEGWYFLASLTLPRRNVLALSTEAFHDLIPGNEEVNGWHGAISHLFRREGDKVIAELSLPQKTNPWNEISVEIQYQVFFNM